MTSEKTDNAREQAQAQYDSVREMIAALECDYDRLEALAPPSATRRNVWRAL